MIIVLSRLLVHRLRQHLFQNHYMACRRIILQANITIAIGTAEYGWTGQTGPTDQSDRCDGGQPSNIYTEHVYSLLGNP